MKNIFLSILIFTITQQLIGQQNYCDFEGMQVISFGPSTGTLDSMIVNPTANSINNSANCGKYIRNVTLYDNFKLYPHMRLVDVTPYAANSLSTPKITMKVYSTAPVGTFVELQLGSKSDDNYPSGIHSEYRAVTTVTNAWENLTFNYLQSPSGGLVASIDVDKIVILFHPNSSNSETMYFDDLTGPPLFISGVYENEGLPSFKLYQNNPNPAKGITHIDFQLTSPGLVSLKLFDRIGNPILSILDKNMKTGIYSIPVETENIPGGIYFYVLKKEGVSRTKKMIVAK